MQKSNFISNKSGGGTAREIKTKSAKKKGGGKRGGGGDDDEDDDASSRGGGGGRGEVHLELMTAEEMSQFLEDNFEGLPESLATEMVEELERPVNKKYTEEGGLLF